MIASIRLLAFAFCGLNVAAPLSHVTAVTFNVVDAYEGEVFPAQLSIYNVATGAEIKQDRGRQIQLPYGAYQIRVSCPGFKNAEKVVRLETPASWITIGLELGGIEAPVTQQLLGTVEPINRKSPVWAKLVGVYLDFEAEVLIDSRGRFAFQDVPPGAYLLLIVEHQHVLATQHVALRNGTPPLPVVLSQP